METTAVMPTAEHEKRTEPLSIRKSITTIETICDTIISENTMLQAEVARVNAKLVLSEKRVAELETYISLHHQNSNGKCVICFEPWGNQGGGNEQADRLQTLEKMVEKERSGRLDAELEVDRLKNLFIKGDKKRTKCVDGFGKQLIVTTEVNQNLSRLKKSMNISGPSIQFKHLGPK